MNVSARVRAGGASEDAPASSSVRVASWRRASIARFASSSLPSVASKSKLRGPSRASELLDLTTLTLQWCCSNNFRVLDGRSRNSVKIVHDRSDPRSSGGNRVRFHQWGRGLAVTRMAIPELARSRMNSGSMTVKLSDLLGINSSFRRLRPDRGRSGIRSIDSRSSRQA